MWTLTNTVKLYGTQFSKEYETKILMFKTEEKYCMTSPVCGLKKKWYKWFKMDNQQGAIV